MTPIEPPPPALACSRVLEYAVRNDTVGFSGRTLLFVDGKELGRVPCLAICEDKKLGGVLLFHCDSEWDVLGIAGYDSVGKAKDRAEHIYPGLSACCVDAHISEEEAERHLDEAFGGDRCGFCGKRPDQTERVIVGHKARICNNCVEEFHRTLHKTQTKQYKDSPHISRYRGRGRLRP